MASHDSIEPSRPAGCPRNAPRHPPAVRTVTRMALPLALLLAACNPPTRMDVEQAAEAQRERAAYCEDLREQADANNDRPLIRANLLDRYNRDCLGAAFDPTDG